MNLAKRYHEYNNILKIKMSKHILFSFFILHCSLSIVVAQNLVPNPSFEDTVSCPTDAGDIFKSVGWYSPSSASPDYFNECDPNETWLSTPQNWDGFQYPRTGKAYAGILVFYNYPTVYREYVRAQLTQPLVYNFRYCIDFYVSLSDNSKWAISNVGAYFSPDNYIDPVNSWLDLQPQIENPNSSYLNDKDNWMKVSGCFIASGGEEYITIGNFMNDENTDTLITASWANPFGDEDHSYYYIDDVSIIEDNTNRVENGLQIFLRIYPNPCTSYFVIEQPQNDNKIMALELLNIFGQQIDRYENINQKQTIDVRFLENGIYIVRAKLNNNQVINQKLIINH
ncbi:MAG: T9SS type A sorting domain-containing protein [Bacteroidia bacterium]